MNTEASEVVLANDVLDPEAGMTTAEYAVGTVGATGIAGILLWLVQQDWFRELFANVFRTIFKI